MCIAVGTEHNNKRQSVSFFEIKSTAVVDSWAFYTAWGGEEEVACFRVDGWTDLDSSPDDLSRLTGTFMKFRVLVTFPRSCPGPSGTSWPDPPRLRLPRSSPLPRSPASPQRPDTNCSPGFRAQTLTAPRGARQSQSAATGSPAARGTLGQVAPAAPPSRSRGRRDPPGCGGCESGPRLQMASQEEASVGWRLRPPSSDRVSIAPPPARPAPEPLCQC